MILNKIFKIIGAFSLCLPIIATDKLYVGINTGRTAANIELNRNFINLVADNSNIGQDTIHAATFIGYNHLITETPIFVGIEFCLQTHEMEAIKGENIFPPFVSYETRVKTNTSCGGTIKLGIVIKDVLIYGKGGIMMTNWTTNFIDKSDATANNHIFKKHNKVGTTFGFGVDYNLNSNWAIGIDHTITHHSKLNMTHRLGTFRFSPSLSTTSIRLIYKF